ncbi:DUF3558 family protein [Actinoalloteichus hymeniacidonis]|uniref:DUF3558 family protein n=1 Tax=Actinoalloteichus hymeniacidonis TaxID=340345 RepID=A0AAC9MXH0_9PSEU|nr:DUF3558 family protein [Actinoalloteichus hymeniacidonis]AOS63223.1 putative DUF3558 family protein [Actinoalloteichus hymeniacidonis]MBB5908738.1 hypothetical protein [Actinoalloteichus hymeniacidonis]
MSMSIPRLASAGASAALLLFLAGCGEADSAAPGGDSDSRSSVETAEDELIAAAKRACDEPTQVVLQELPDATGNYTTNRVQGPTCNWTNREYLEGATITAISGAPYAEWLESDTLITGETSTLEIGGLPATQGATDEGCAVLVDVSGAALSVEVRLVRDDTPCEVAAELASEVLDGR